MKTTVEMDYLEFREISEAREGENLIDCVKILFCDGPPSHLLELVIDKSTLDMTIAAMEEAICEVKKIRQKTKVAPEGIPTEE